MAGVFGGGSQTIAPLPPPAPLGPTPSELARRRSDREQQMRGRQSLVVSNTGLATPRGGGTGLSIPTGNGQ